MARAYFDPAAFRAAYVAGDHAAVGAALMTLAGKVVGMAHAASPLPPGLDLADVEAQAVLEMYRRLDRLDPARPPSAWFTYLTQAVRNEVRRSVRNHDCRRRRTRRLSDLE